MKFNCSAVVSPVDFCREITAGEEENADYFKRRETQEEEEAQRLEITKDLAEVGGYMIRLCNHCLWKHTKKESFGLNVIDVVCTLTAQFACPRSCQTRPGPHRLLVVSPVVVLIGAGVPPVHDLVGPLLGRLPVPKSVSGSIGVAGLLELARIFV